ncbi:MAG: GerW family sporulation protein [Oscillospiraceae bacterium]|nr:GerW family sporulation protein [Oscillospiraceae bacterium]
MSEHISGLTDNSMKNLKTLVDADTVIGNPITTPDGTMIIPVSKVSFGFATGGSDLAAKSPKDVCGGGSGGGVTIQPTCFLVVKNGDVKILHINSNNSTGSQIVNMVPDVIDKISGIVKKDKTSADDTVVMTEPTI